MKFKGKKAAELRSIIAELEGRSAAKLLELKDGLSDADVRGIERAHNELVADIAEARSALEEAERVDIEGRVAQSLAAEQGRRDAIADTSAKLGLPAEFATQHIRANTTLDAFRVAAIEEAAKIDRSAPTDGVNRGLNNPTYLPGLKRKEPEQGELAMRMIAAVAVGKKFGVSPIEAATRHSMGDIVVRALQASIGSAGGYMIPIELSAELIDLLRPRTVVRKATPNSRQISIPRGNLTMGRINAGATIGYVGEGQSSAYTQEVIGDINFTARKAKAIVPVSNDLIRFAQGSADAMVRDDLIRQLAVLEDASFLRGAGTVWTPKGMRYLAAAANIIGSNQAFNVATAIADMTSLINALESAAVPMTAPHWFFSQRTKNFFYDARDAVGGFLFRAEMDRGFFRGIPYSWTQSIPQNLGGGANASEVYLVDMDEFIIADVPGLMIDASQEATYSDGTNLHSAFDQDETVIRVIAEHDCNVKHTSAIGVLTGVVWQ
jgi:HK97 family phage major capsid protein